MAAERMTARTGGEGWGWPPVSRKAHYIGPDGRSICGKIGFAFDLLLEQGNDGSTDNCAGCKRSRVKAGSDSDGR